MSLLDPLRTETIKIAMLSRGNSEAIASYEPPISNRTTVDGMKIRIRSVGSPKAASSKTDRFRSWVLCFADSRMRTLEMSTCDIEAVKKNTMRATLAMPAYKPAVWASK
jgi:hypothetical protein